MESLGQSIGRSVREAIASRAVSLAIATLVLMLGLYPGPALLLLHSPAWTTNYVVRQFLVERDFWIAGLVVIVAPAVVLANLVPAGFERVWQAVATRLLGVRPRWFIIGAAVFATIAAAAAAVYVLSRKATTSDEIAQLWQARVLLSGRLSLPVDPNPEFFAIDNVIDRGRWYSQFPIGWPAMLALAMLAHATWLLNPLLAGLTVWNVYRFASQVYGEAEARLGALLCATCPYALIVSGSYMNHTPVAFLTTLALAELPAWNAGSDRRRAGAAIAIGFSLGMAIAIRPLDGAIAAGALGGVLVYDAVRQRRPGSLLVVMAAGAVPIALLAVANRLTTGHPLLFGYEVLWGANHSLGFHNDPSGNPHTPARALALAAAYLSELNWSLFEWPVAGLLIVGVALIAIGKLGRWDALLLVWIGGQLTAYAAYWHLGTFFGPRYLFTVVPAFLIIVAHGVILAYRKGTPLVGRTIVAAIAASTLSSWLIRTTPVGTLGSAESARAVRAAFKLDFEPLVSSLEGQKALIFVSEGASSRLSRRIWGLGISRPDAAQLIATRDHCALLDAVLDEAQQGGSPSDRLARLQRSKSYAPPPGWRFMVSDDAFRTSNPESVTARCRTELLADRHRRAVISYGSTLLLNDIGPDGRVAGPIIFVADLAEHNDVLRARFADRTWYRLEAPAGTDDRSPRLIPYK